jgi:3'(2'), 5'-bisphosphate nucleotidase
LPPCGAGGIGGSPPLASTAPLRLLVSRSRPPRFVQDLAERLGAVTVPMGSAGAKAAAVITGDADAYVHSGGQYEWDSAAPVAVARSAGLHTSRIDGSRLTYNQASPSLPDILICRAAIAPQLLETIGSLVPGAAAEQPASSPSTASSTSELS